MAPDINNTRWATSLTPHENMRAQKAFVAIKSKNRNQFVRACIMDAVRRVEQMEVHK